MNIYDLIPEISSNIIFRNADKTKVSEFLKDDNISVTEYKEGDIIVDPNAKEIRIGIIMGGTVEISSPALTHKVLLKTAGKGFLFGVANLYLEGSDFPTRISARTPSKVLLIKPDAFRSMLESDEKMMADFLKFLCQKIVYLNRKIASYTVGNTEQKLAYFIYENAVDGVVGVDMSLSDIAVMLDMGRASLYRALDNLEANNIIARNGRKIEIIDKQKLKNIYIN